MPAVPIAVLRRLVPLLLLLLAVPAASAHAATVLVGPDPDDAVSSQGPPPAPFLSVYAAAGERNDVRLTLGADGSVVVRDRGVPPTAGDGCAPVDATAVSCTVAAPNRFLLQLGDEDDRLVVEDHRTTLPGTDLRGQVQADGGPGDDRLTGGAHSDLLTAGTGADVLRGGGGDDRLELGERDLGALVGTPAAPARRDVADGGPGRDVVAYRGEPGGVRAHLTTPQGGGRRGAPARRLDRYVDVEALEGTVRADVLLGSGRADGLDGVEGDDEVRGGAGDDAVSGSGTIDGGAGADTLRAASGSVPTTLRCGTGSDIIQGVSGRDLVGSDCEAVDLIGSVRLVPRPTRSPAGLQLTTSCTAPQPNYNPLGCPPGSRLDVAVRTPPADGAFQDRGPFDLPLAAGSYVVPPTGASPTPVSVALPAAPGAAGVLARRGRQLVAVSVDGQLPGPSGFRFHLGDWQVALAAPRG